ncbi:MAG: CcmD family protein [Bacteroidia bacterium]
MNKIVKNLSVLFSMLLLSVSAAFAQLPAECTRPEMADGMYQSGKIYVVVTVLAIIFAGIIGYLVVLDRKIGKLEKEIKK